MMENMHMKAGRQGQFARKTLSLVQKPEQGILGPRILFPLLLLVVSCGLSFLPLINLCAQRLENGNIPKNLIYFMVKR